MYTEIELAKMLRKPSTLYFIYLLLFFWSLYSIFLDNISNVLVLQYL